MANEKDPSHDLTHTFHVKAMFLEKTKAEEEKRRQQRIEALNEAQKEIVQAMEKQKDKELEARLQVEVTDTTEQRYKKLLAKKTALEPQLHPPGVNPPRMPMSPKEYERQQEDLRNQIQADNQRLTANIADEIDRQKKIEIDRFLDQMDSKRKFRGNFARSSKQGLEKDQGYER